MFQSLGPGQPVVRCLYTEVDWKPADLGEFRLGHPEVPLGGPGDTAGRH